MSPQDEFGKSPRMTKKPLVFLLGCSLVVTGCGVTTKFRPLRSSLGIGPNAPKTAAPLSDPPAGSNLFSWWRKKSTSTKQPAGSNADLFARQQQLAQDRQPYQMTPDFDTNLFADPPAQPEISSPRQREVELASHWSTRQNQAANSGQFQSSPFLHVPEGDDDDSDAEPIVSAPARASQLQDEPRYLEALRLQELAARNARVPQRSPQPEPETNAELEPSQDPIPEPPRVQIAAKPTQKDATVPAVPQTAQRDVVNKLVRLGNSPADRSALKPAALDLEAATFPTVIYRENQVTICTPGDAGEGEIKSVLICKVRGQDANRRQWFPVTKGQTHLKNLSTGAYDIYFLTTQCQNPVEQPSDAIAEPASNKLPNRRIIVQLWDVPMPTSRLPWERDPVLDEATGTFRVQQGEGPALDWRSNDVPAGQKLAKLPVKSNGNVSQECRDAWKLLRKSSIFAAQKKFATVLTSVAQSVPEQAGDQALADTSLEQILSADPAILAKLRSGSVQPAQLAAHLHHRLPSVPETHVAMLGWAKSLDAIALEGKDKGDGTEVLALAGFLACRSWEGNEHGASNDAAILLHRLKYSGRAIQLLHEAMQESPEPVVAYNLGCVYRDLNRPEEAFQCWKWACDQDAAFAEAKSSLVHVCLMNSARALYPKDCRVLMVNLAELANHAQEHLQVAHWQQQQSDCQTALQLKQELTTLVDELQHNGVWKRETAAITNTPKRDHATFSHHATE